MVYNYSEVINKYGNDYNLNKAINNNEIFKIEKGIYSDKQIANPLIIISKKYPDAILTLDTAFYYYDLTDVIPQKTYVATKRNGTKIKNEKIVQIFVSDSILEIGKTQVEIDGNVVNIYDKERLLIELIRRKNQIPLDYYKEIINNYRNHINELQMRKIERYVSLFITEEHILDVIQMEVF